MSYDDFIHVVLLDCNCVTLTRIMMSNPQPVFVLGF